ncbi:hypothetical protein GUJ93_ZPchr0013g36890 [Zizania palustris]|uniref:Uncharacterized protein n=1 Tax=Zizania palustris TaxID=103762 RepID=A0A8J5X1J4_ZIZPA|nr:hypothetical protein GUJ93_ZPchr0013g36890 [Zizania palustris]
MMRGESLARSPLEGRCSYRWLRRWHVGATASAALRGGGGFGDVGQSTPMPSGRRQWAAAGGDVRVGVLAASGV